MRASKEYHAIASFEVRRRSGYAEVAAPRADPVDTEALYFELLKLIGGHLDLRVIVDIIAGASAGGVNGVTLARALAHDLSLSPVTDAWLDRADVAQLMTDAVRAKAWSKFYLTPFIHYLSRFHLTRISQDRELRRKLSMFLRSRWFKPPFDGLTLTEMYFSAADRMGEGRDRDASLVPAGQQLRLFITVTDFHGYRQYLQIHDPQLVCEHEHRHVLQFAYRHWPGGAVLSDFDRDHLPGLIFAARATSSYPGAFPPAQVGEIDELLRQLGRTWPQRTAFLAAGFHAQLRQGLDIERASFIDGGVLNNKPFAEAIAAIRGLPAYREVDRRLVYIDPDPQEPGRRPPGFFQILLAALSGLPRSQPIRDDLAFVSGYNERVRRIKAMMESARPHIEAAVRRITGEAVCRDPAAVGELRRAAHRVVAAEVGLFYSGYLDLKLDVTVAHVAGLLASACDAGGETRERHRLNEALREWARRRGICPRAEQTPTTAERAPAWLEFLDRFDLGFRERRLRFLIRALNEHYPRIGHGELAALDAGDLDGLKSDLYAIVATLRPFRDGGFLDAPTRSAARDLLGRLEHGIDAEVLAALDALIGRCAEQMRLGQTCSAVEQRLLRDEGATANEALRRALLSVYIGYAFWDVLTFSITNWRSIGEFDEIRIDRISPQDATRLHPAGARSCLMGIELESFGAFFSRRFRENDYLWGRLHAAERLVDIVCSAAPTLDAEEHRQVEQIKKRLFAVIVAQESAQLKTIGAEIAAIEQAIARL